MPSGSRRTLITGASAGIGLELAREFASHGHPVILVARNEARLNEIATQLNQAHRVEVTVIPCDLGKANGPLELFAAVGQRNLQVDILVNNAGVMDTGAFKDAETDTLIGMVRLNVEAVTALTSLFLKPMVARGRGRILNVASLAAAITEHGRLCSEQGLCALAHGSSGRGTAGKGCNSKRPMPWVHRHQYGRECQTRERGLQGSACGAHGRSEIRCSGWLPRLHESRGDPSAWDSTPDGHRAHTGAEV